LKQTPPPIVKPENEALLAALKPPKRQCPVIASIGINDATETTDYLMPYGILRRADVADVVLLATQRGPVTLFSRSQGPTQRDGRRIRRSAS
jgi:putative intracellular protease/amidase